MDETAPDMTHLACAARGVPVTPGCDSTDNHPAAGRPDPDVSRLAHVSPAGCWTVEPVPPTAR
ncbi:hypothetical protein [Streptomyces pseudovenezuelae]|uniref:Uncharacterized protein n=1 Tax=Streptomyces pseudovenezuelae TaxID=67350 RepID=A0ABZ1WWK0_9ACTN|nr:hypothetical protein [Streptomyces pseudovenezuelae]